MSKVVVFAVGGSGGHLIPAQVVAHELLAQDASLRVQFLGNDLSACRFFDNTKFSYLDVPSGSVQWRHPFKSLFSAWNILKGVWISYQFFSQTKTKLVVGFGSHHSFPVILAAWLKNIPFILHESNIYPGQVNRFFASRSKVMLVPYTECRKYLKDPIIQVKMPLRQLRDSSAQARGAAAEYLGLDPKKTTVVVFGGSQGARAINYLSCEAAEMLADRGYQLQVIHLCGHVTQTKLLESAYQKARVKAVVKEFETLMHHVWAMADLAICRSGAMTLAELIEFEVPAIMIPYPYAKDDHQDKNASFFVEQVAGGVKLKQELASPEKLLAILLELLAKKGVALEGYRQHLREFKETMPSKSMSGYLLESL